MKKFKLMLVALMAMIGTNAMAQLTGTFIETNQGVKYEIKSIDMTAGTATVEVSQSDYATKGGATLNIPKEIAWSVNGIDDNGDDVNEEVTFKVVSIAVNGFKDVTKITTLSIADENIATINANAFNGCTGLATATIGAKVGTIDASAFEGCTSLTNLIINEGELTTINADAFKGTAITKLDLSKTEVVNVEALFGATGNATLTEVSLPATVATIKADAFKDCSALTTVKFAALEDGKANVTTITAGAFAGTAITALDLTNTKIDTLNKLFENANGKLQSVILPATLVKIGGNALSNLAKLNSVDLSKCVLLDEIDNDAFDVTPSLTSLDFSTCVKYTDLTKGTTTKPFGAANEFLTSITLPKGKVTTIGTCLAGLSALTTITNLDAITAIVDGAFAGDAALTELSFPKTLATVAGEPFKGCAKLATLTFDATALTALGDGTKCLYGTADADLKALTSLTITGDVIGGAIKAASFAKCTAITTLKIAEGKSIKTSAMGVAAIKVAAKAAITLGNLDVADAGGATGATITAGDGTTLTIGDISKAQSKEIVSGKIATTIGKITAAVAVSLDALGTTATKLTFGGDIIAGATITKYTAANTNLAAIDCGTIAIADDGTFVTKAFNGCTALKTVTWEPAVAKMAFFKADCFAAASVGAAEPGITFTTTTAVGNLYGFLETNLYNVKFGAAASTEAVKVANNGSGNFFYAKYSVKAGAKMRIAKAQESGATAIVYGAYVDEGDDNTIYMEQLHLIDGYYYVPGTAGVGSAIIIKSTTDDDVVVESTVETENSFNYTSAAKLVNQICYLKAATIGTTLMKNTTDLDATNTAIDNTKYDLYALASISKYNITWKKFGASTSLPANTFYVRCKKAPAADRLNVVWLDGSEEEATAIKTVKKVAENGAIYNLAGQKVNASYKGVVIKDGKKYIQK